MSTDQAHPAPGAAPRRQAPFPRILCAVDGSRGAQEAAAAALALAAGGDVQLTFLCVTDVAGFGPTRMASLGPRSAEQAVAEARRRARDAGLNAAGLVRHSADPRRAILEEAEQYDLLVMGAHGHHRAAGIVLGDAAALALHTSAVPVLLARPAPYGTTFPHSILLASDGTPAMARAVALTGALARRHDARVTLAYAGDGDGTTRDELTDEFLRLLEAIGVEPVCEQLDGHAPGAIAELARSLPASLVVTGSRGLSGVRALASVSERTGMIAPCSVLVVR
jgi:nucleotide-binding universal stress UspA family protein